MGVGWEGRCWCNTRGDHAEISAALDEILSFLEPLHMQSRIAGFPCFACKKNLAIHYLKLEEFKFSVLLIPVRLLVIIHLSSSCEVM